ncbi:MAG: hypothetical protein GXP54_11045 [Deltaproteobacteria bacterium]|nr:hypothetical protein [Deltaproteobacteria bacterium]
MSRSMITMMATLALGLGLGCGGSGGNDDTGNTDVVADNGGVTDNGGDKDAQTGNACHQCLLKSNGLSVRFTKMFVTEPSIPEGLPDFLNAIWEPDVADYRLNVILQLEKVTDNGDGTLKLKVKAGAGWHDLAVDQVTPMGHGKTPNEFHFVEGFTTEFDAVVDENCNFSTVGQADLWFHPGPLDHALICSAGDDTIGLPKDTIPISNLIAKGHFNDECTQITDGDLTGCIAADAACQICSFMLAPDYSEWNIETDPSITTENCQPSYCDGTCGKASGNVVLPKGSPLWANFGGFVEGIGVPQTCDVNGGTDNGYALAGEWNAAQIKMTVQ